MSETASQTKVVNIHNLNSSMHIIAYLNFTNEYKPMNAKACKWIQLNFKGSRASIRRLHEEMEIFVERLEEGDHLFKIYNIPSSLSKLAIVTPQLVEALRGRGFITFEVKVRPKKVNAKQQKFVKAANAANAFVQKVRENVKIRDEATDAIEELLDNARKNKLSTLEVKSYVDQMVKHSSTDAVCAIASLKESDQTYAHCIDVGAIFQTTYYPIIKRYKLPSAFRDKEESLMGAFMHDFGKSKVPKEILDSTVRFDRGSQEMKLMQSHPVYSAKLLTGMGMPNYIVNMAHYHHVKMDDDLKSSYPPSVNYDNVLMETRLLAIIDIYQALIGKRSYKKSWAPPAAIRFLDNLAGVEFDYDVWSYFVHTIGRFPKGSLVELSDGSAAFVMDVPLEDLDNPHVVQVRDAEGVHIENHPLIDLAEEPSLSIVKEIENEDFSGDPLETFLKINVKI